MAKPVYSTHLTTKIDDVDVSIDVNEKVMFLRYLDVDEGVTEVLVIHKINELYSFLKHFIDTYEQK